MTKRTVHLRIRALTKGGAKGLPLRSHADVLLRSAPMARPDAMASPAIRLGRGGRPMGRLGTSGPVAVLVTGMLIAPAPTQATEPTAPAASEVADSGIARRQEIFGLAYRDFWYSEGALPRTIHLFDLDAAQAQRLTAAWQEAAQRIANRWDELNSDYFDRYSSARGNPESMAEFNRWYADVRSAGDAVMALELERFGHALHQDLSRTQIAAWDQFVEAVRFWTALEEIRPTVLPGAGVDFLAPADWRVPLHERLFRRNEADVIVETILADWLREASRLSEELRRVRAWMADPSGAAHSPASDLSPDEAGEFPAMSPDLQDLPAREIEIQLELRDLNAVIFEALHDALPSPEGRLALERMFYPQALPSTFGRHRLELWFERVLLQRESPLSPQELRRAQDALAAMVTARTSAQWQIGPREWQRLRSLDASGLPRRLPTATIAQLTEMVRTNPFAIGPDPEDAATRDEVLALATEIDARRLELHALLTGTTDAFLTSLAEPVRTQLPALPVVRPPIDLMTALRDLRRLVLEGVAADAMPVEVPFDEGVIVVADALAIVTYDSYPDSGRARRPDMVIDLAP